MSAALAPSGVDSRTDATTSATAAELAGRYLVTSLTGFTLVPGSLITIAITADRLAIDGSGCAPMSGFHTLRDGHLEVVLEPVPPHGVCDIDPVYLGEDQWLFRFLATRPEVEIDDDRVVLTAVGTGVMELQRIASDRVAAVMAGEWKLDSIVGGGVRTAASVQVTMGVSVNGMLRLSTACNSMVGTVSVSDTAFTTTGLVPAMKPCDPEVSELEQLVSGTFADTAPYVLSDDRLTLTGENGTELHFTRG